jgi:hypothetical protein
MDLNYLTPHAEVRTAGPHGDGSFASHVIRAGTTVAVFGGYPVTRAALDELPIERQRRSMQIDDDLFLVSGEQPERGDRVNHSCRPNCAMFGNVVLVALRDIDAGEQLTFDYATSDGCDYDEFDCSCGEPTCRGRITGNDWMLPELQRAYRGWFSPYLARRIAERTSVGYERRVFAYG